MRCGDPDPHEVELPPLSSWFALSLSLALNLFDISREQKLLPPLIFSILIPSLSLSLPHLNGCIMELGGDGGGGVEITTVIAALLRNPEATAKERRKEGLVTPPLTKGVPLPCSSAQLSSARHCRQPLRLRERL